MNKRVALCIDEATCLTPALIGLDDQALDNQVWLAPFCNAEHARQAIAQDEDIVEAWVVSNDEIAPINLAATLKADRPDLRVRLVEGEAGGSLLSRAHSASIDDVISPATFVRLFSETRRRAVLSIGQGAGMLGVDTPGASEADALAEMESLGQPSHVAMSAETALPNAPAASAAVSEAMLIATAMDAVSSTFLMPVVSGSGGAGKSAISVLGALTAVEMGFHTLLLDCDLQFGDAAVALGDTSALSLDEVLVRPDLLERLCQAEGLAVLAAPKRLESAEYLSHEIPRLLGTVAGRFDVIVANTGSSWSEYHAVLLERASAALFLIDQRASSLRACKHALELCGRCGIATGPFRYALNRCAKGALFNTIDISCALQGQPVFELKDGGPEVEEYLGAGAAAELLGEKNDLCASMRRMLEQILPEAPGVISVSARVEKTAASHKRGKHHLRRSRGV